ncbi:hypothetical protein ACFWJT_04690 [Streptomyces sp. NPDC127069]
MTAIVLRLNDACEVALLEVVHPSVDWRPCAPPGRGSVPRSPP